MTRVIAISPTRSNGDPWNTASGRTGFAGIDRRRARARCAREAEHDWRPSRSSSPLALTGALASPAMADDYPTWEELQAAKSNTQAAADKVTQITELIAQLKVQVAETQAEAVKRGEELAASPRTRTTRPSARPTRSRPRPTRVRPLRMPPPSRPASSPRSSTARAETTSPRTSCVEGGDGAKTDALLSQLGSMSKLVQRSTEIYDSARTAANTAAALGKQAEVAQAEREKLRVAAEAALAAAVEAQQAAEAALAESQAKSIELAAQLKFMQDTQATVAAEYQKGVEERARLERERLAREAAAARGCCGGGRRGNGGSGAGLPGGWVGPQGWGIPGYGRITDGYGPRPSINGSGTFHYGADIGTGCSAPIYAAAARHRDLRRLPGHVRQLRQDRQRRRNRHGLRTHQARRDRRRRRTVRRRRSVHRELGHDRRRRPAATSTSRSSRAVVASTRSSGWPTMEPRLAEKDRIRGSRLTPFSLFAVVTAGAVTASVGIVGTRPRRPRAIRRGTRSRTPRRTRRRRRPRSLASPPCSAGCRPRPMRRRSSRRSQRRRIGTPSRLSTAAQAAREGPALAGGRSSHDAKTSRMRAGLIAAHLARSGGKDLSVDLFLNGDTATDLLHRLGSASKLSEQSQEIYREALQDSNTATSLAAQADAAAAERKKLAADAEAKLASAQVAAKAAEDAYAEQVKYSDELYSQLATLKDTTAALEKERIEGIAAAEAAAAAEQAAAAKAAAEKAAADKAAADKAAQDAANGGGGGGGGGGQAPAPAPSSAPAPPPAPNGNLVETAIAFASAQLGKPYSSPGDSRNTWDCSGLTKAAYAAAGSYIGTHSATNQYRTMAAQGRLVPYSQRQRGDLIFWGGGGDYYHVAIYLGGGRILEAADWGKPVREWYIWGGNDVAGMVGRPG